MSEPFAYPSDIEDRWRPLSSDESDRAETLLDDASATLRALDPTLDQQLDSGTLDAAIPLMIVCAMVKRAMSAGDFEGASGQSISTGPFSQNITFANPTGNMYVTKTERRLLGVGGQVAFTIDQGAAAAITCVQPYSEVAYRGDFDYTIPQA